MTTQDYATRISQLIQEHEADIGAEWIEQLEALTLRSNVVSKDQLRKHCQQFLTAFAQATRGGELQNIDHRSWDDVRDILKRTHTTALMVTHDQMEAFAVADVVGVMRQGQLEQWDTPYALYHRPATRFAADFIGHGVLLQGQLRGRDANAQALVSRPATGHHQGNEQEEIEVETAAGLLRGVPLHALHGQQAAQTSEVDVLLRADDVIHDDASPFRARVVRKSFRGALAPSHHDHDHAVGEWIGIRLEVTHLVTFARTESASAGLAVAAVAPAAPVALAPMAADAADLAHEASRR